MKRAKLLSGPIRPGISPVLSFLSRQKSRQSLALSTSVHRVKSFPFLFGEWMIWLKEVS